MQPRSGVENIGKTTDTEATTAKKLILPPLKDKLEDMDISLHLHAAHMGPTLQTLITH